MAEMHLDPTAPAPAGPVADRRRFLRLGGTGLIAAAVLAACGDDEETPPAETGTTVPPTETTLGPAQTTTPEAGAEQDAVVTRTLRSVELAMVEVYGLLLGEGGSELSLPEGVTLPTFSDQATAALELMAERHATHADELVTIVEQAGGDTVSEPNAGLLGGLVEPRLADMTTEANVLRTLLGLEETLASTYAWGAGTLSEPGLRQSLMGVGAVSARHGVLLSLLLEPSGTNAVASPRVDISGPARLADFMLVPVDGDGGDALTEPAPAEGEGEDVDDVEGGDTSESGDEGETEGDPTDGADTGTGGG